MPRIIIHTCIATTGPLARARLRRLSRELAAQGIEHTRTASAIHLFAALVSESPLDDRIVAYHRSLAGRISQVETDCRIHTDARPASDPLPSVH